MTVAMAPDFSLGLSFGMHDSAAALVRGSTIVAAVEEERLTHEKHSNGFPVRSIETVLAMAGIGIGDIARVGFNFRPDTIRDHVLRGIARERFPHDWQFFRGHLEWFRNVRDGVRHGMRRHFGYRGPQFALDHHYAHAASAYLCSPFEHALVVTIDGTGDRYTTAFWVGEGTKLRLIADCRYPHSVGLLYSMVTYHLALGLFGEGKLMGLAAYGEDRYHSFFDAVLRLAPGPGDGAEDLFTLDRDFFNWPEGLLFLNRAFSRRALDVLGPARQRPEAMTAHHMDVAASMQACLERVVMRLIRAQVAKTGLRDICIAGGVGLNSVLNGKISQSDFCDRLFIQPAAGDSGAAIGVALHLASEYGGCARGPALAHCYLGPAFSNDEIRASLSRHGLGWREPEDVVEECARLLARGKTVGWFQGAMEFGPRALGHRSILAHPGDPTMRDHLNAEVKHREMFRPFAASVPEEQVSHFFTVDGPSPYMLLVGRVKQPHLLPSVTHVDGTCRVQTVSELVDPTYFRLHRCFERHTGIPVLLNTSFNVKGEPIVCSPDDAITCFLQTRIDHLVIGNVIVDKPDDHAYGLRSSDAQAASVKSARPGGWLRMLADLAHYGWATLHPQVPPRRMETGPFCTRIA